MAARGAGLPTAVHTHFRAHAEFKVRYAREDSSIVRMRKGIKTPPICKFIKLAMAGQFVHELGLRNDQNLARYVIEGRSTGKQLGTGSYGSVQEVFYR